MNTELDAEQKVASEPESEALNLNANEQAAETEKAKFGEAKPENLVDLTEETDKVIDTIGSSDGGPALERELNSLGKGSIKHAMEMQSLMQPSIESTLPDLDSSSPLASILNDASSKMVQLNPNTVKNGFLFKYIPLKSVKRYLIKEYVGNFLGESEKVQSIFDGLNRGKEELLVKMIEMEEQYHSLRKTDISLKSDIALCTSVQERLESFDPEQMDENDQRKLSLSKNKIARRIRDLETVRAAIGQFYISIDQTFEINTQLNDSIDSVMLVGPIVLQNAIKINSAISKQKEVSLAVQNVSETLGSAMRENASLVKENASRVADLYSNPVIALKDFEDSYSDLLDAMRTTNDARDNATKTAKQMSSSLAKMTNSIDSVASGLDQLLPVEKEKAIN